jgi:uncharacterized membrane protein
MRDTRSLNRLVIVLLAGFVGAQWMGAGGFLLGMILGYLLYEQRVTSRLVQELQQQLAALSGVRPLAVAEPAAEATAPPPAWTLPEPATPEPVRQPEPDSEPPAGGVPGVPGAEDSPRERRRAALRAQREANPLRPRPAPRARSEGETGRAAAEVFSRVRAFFLGGNTLVRVGVVILFIGLAFLVQYAVEHALFPIELRLAATAAIGIALTGLGWRLRERRREFALTLQGGGTAILYLTIFAAFRLYALVPSGAAFALLVATTALGGALALLQNSQGLAVLSLLGGFFAPVLASTGEGSHVALFSYYAILNGAVLALAWFRAWRPLSLVGFFCTFGIAGLWVAEAYEPALFVSTQAFLALFFLCYFAVALLHARREHTSRGERVVDGTLVFGLPVAAFSLQAVIVQPYAYGLAWSAFVYGCFYAVAAYLLYRRAPALVLELVESFAGIGLALGTMVLPFALDAGWTGTGWALEGAALVWLGYRQRRPLLRLAGAGLQVAASLAFAVGLEQLGGIGLPILNRYFFGCLALALSALFTAYLVHRRREETESWALPLEHVFLTLGLGWWLFGGAGEIFREAGPALGTHLLAVLVAGTALLCALLWRPLAWRTLCVPAALALPAFFLLLLASAAHVGHPFEAGGWVAWALAAAVHVAVLRLTEAEQPSGVARVLHGAGVWFVAVVLAWEAGWLLNRAAPVGSVWGLLGFGLVMGVLVILVAQVADREAWPFGPWRGGYLLWGAVPLLAAAWYWSMYVSATSAGDPSPLPYAPVLNPLDLVLALLALAGAAWYRVSRRRLPGFGSAELRRALLWALAGTAFVWVNATLGQTVHAWAGVPYDADALLASGTFQAALTILWASLSVGVMALAARRRQRGPWVAAAVLLGVTVVKLFVVDLAALGTVTRIGVFIGVGLLLLLIGYLAPLPPERRGPVEAPPPDEPVEVPA